MTHASLFRAHSFRAHSFRLALTLAAASLATVSLTTLSGCAHNGCTATATSAIDAPAADKAQDVAQDVAQINASIQHLAAAVNARDLDSIMSYYVPGNSLFVYDVIPPRQYVGAAAYRKDWEGFLAAFPGPIHVTASDWVVDTEGSLAFAHGIFKLDHTGKNGKPDGLTARITDVYRKINGKWLVVHEHVSVPVNPETGKPDMNSSL